MGNFLEIISQLVVAHPSWTQGIIAGGMIVQAELTILLSVFLIIDGELRWMDFFVVALGSLVLAETLVYILGRSLRTTRFGWKLYYRTRGNRTLQLYAYYLKTHLVKLFVVSKFLVGTNLVILLLTGWIKTTFRRFLSAYLPSIALWFFGMTAIAYFLMSGLHYLKSEKIFRQIEIGIMIVIAVIFCGEFLLRKILKKKVFAGKEIPASLADIEEEEKKK